MSELPKGWVEAKLEQAVDILDSQRSPISSKERLIRIAGKKNSELFPYYGATGKTGVIDGYLFDDELIALGEDGIPFFDPTKHKAYMIYGKTWVNNHAHVLKAIHGLTFNKYICEFLNQFDYMGYVNGGTRLKLTQANMRKIVVPLAPLAEQKRIVEKLDQVLAQVDTIKARLDGIPAILKRFRQSVLAAAVSGKLTEEWRKSVSLRAPNIDEIKKYWKDQYDLSGKKFKSADLSEKEIFINLPKSWLITQIGEVCDVFVGATPSRKKLEYWNGDIPWVSSSEVAFCRISSTKESITVEGLSDTSTHVHPIGTVMLAMIGQGKTRGQVAILDIEACHNQNTAALRVPEGYVLSEFLYFFLTKQYEETRRIGAGNNQKALNKSFVQSLSFPLPSFEEQAEIVRLVDQYFAFADTIEKQVQKAQQRVDKLTQSILAKAFRGELVPQDNPLDEGYEPADELLKRIAAARAESEALAKAAKKINKKNQ